MKRLFTLSTMIMLFSCLIAWGQTDAEKKALRPFLETEYKYDNETEAIPNYKRIVTGAANLDEFWSAENNYVETNEKGEITKINWMSKKLYGDFSLSGLTALTDLYCAQNNLSSLDVSKNEALTDLYCNDNNLSSLDVSANLKLAKLACHNNRLSSLDVSKNKELNDLSCSNNSFSSLDLSQNAALTSLSCDDNNLSSLDVSKNIKLTSLYCKNANLSSLDVSENKELAYLHCYGNNLSSLDVSANEKLKQLFCQGNHLSFGDLLKAQEGKADFGYAPQTLTLEVVSGQEIDMVALGLFITGKETRYLIDEKSGTGTELKKSFRVPAYWTPGKTYTLNMWMENDVLPDFKTEGYLELSLTVIGAASTDYHTITLELCDGIWCDYQTGQLTVAEGDHLYLQFHAEDPALTAADILFLVDGAETPFKASVDGRSGSYILNPVTKDHTIVIAQKEYTVTMPEVDGAVTDPAAGVHKASYGEPFRFTLSLNALKDLNEFNEFKDLKVYANDTELTPRETGQAQSLQFTIDAVEGPIDIRIEGVNPTGNAGIAEGDIQLRITNHQLQIENTGKPCLLQVYTLTGNLYISRTLPQGATTVSLPGSVYVVRAGTEVYKVVVN